MEVNTNKSTTTFYRHRRTKTKGISPGANIQFSLPVSIPRTPLNKSPCFPNDNVVPCTLGSTHNHPPPTRRSKLFKHFLNKHLNSRPSSTARRSLSIRWHVCGIHDDDVVASAQTTRNSAKLIECQAGSVLFALLMAMMRQQYIELISVRYRGDNDLQQESPDIYPNPIWLV